MALAETQELLVRIRYVTDKSGMKNPVADIVSKSEAAGSKGGKAASRAWMDSFNKGIGSGKFKRLAGIGSDIAGGGLKFLERTVLATAAAGVALEYQFIKVQNAAAGMARTLEGETAETLERVKQDILELSTRIPEATTELFRIAQVGGTIGIAADDIEEFTEVIAKMAATTDLGADAAAMGMGRLLNIFGMVNEKGQAVADEADNIASAMLKLSVSQASTDQEILLATERFGALATTMGLIPPQILAISSAGAALGQRPEALGGSLQRIFAIFNKALGNEEVTPQLKKMAEVSGTTSKQLREDWETDPFSAFVKFLEGFGKFSAKAQAQLFGGTDNLFPSFVRGQQTLQGLAARTDLLKEGARAATEAYEANRLLDEQFAVRTDTIQAKLQLLGNAFTRVGVAFGDAFNEELGDGILNLTKMLNDLIPQAEAWGRRVGQAIKEIDWKAAAKFAQDFFSVFAFGVNSTKAILDTLGPKITGILVLLKTVDSLSGGLFSKAGGSAISGIIKVAFDYFGARGSSPLNPVYVSGIGVGGVPGPGGIGNQLATLGVIGVAIANFAMLPTAIDGAIKSITGMANIFSTSPGASVGQIKAGLMSLAEGLKFNPFNLLLKPEIIDKLLSRGALPLGLKPGDGPFGSDLAAAADAQRHAAAAYEAGMRDDLISSEMLADAASTFSEATNKFLDSIKPRHREGEKGKSIQSGEFRRLERIDPSRTDRIALLLGDLVKHYKTEGIGTKEHPMAWIQRSFKGVWGDIAASIRSAMKRGDTAGVGKLIDHLRNLKELGIKLPPGIRRLIKKADDNTQENKETKQAINRTKNVIDRGLERNLDKIQDVKTAIARKKLSVKTVVGGTKVNQGNVYVTTRVSATIAQRTIVRSSRYVAYGPTYTYGGSGTHSLYGDQPT